GSGAGNLPDSEPLAAQARLDDCGNGFVRVGQQDGAGLMVRLVPGRDHAISPLGLGQIEVAIGLGDGFVHGPCRGDLGHAGGKVTWKARPSEEAKTWAESASRALRTAFPAPSSEVLGNSATNSSPP